jgi:hypothetical protein
MSESFVSLASYRTAAEGQLVLNYLREAEVAAFLTGELTAGVMSHIQPIGPQVSLHVAASDLKRARDILHWLGESDALPDDWEDDEPADADVWRCLICGEAIEVEVSNCPYCGSARP